MKNKKAVVITGACGGIGATLTRCFKQEGYFVVATDKLVTPGKNVAHDYYLAVDLEKTVIDTDYAREIFDQIKQNSPADSIHVLINNAAVQILGGLIDLTVSDWHHTLNVNLLAPFVWTKGLITELEREQGAVINISSIHARLTKKGFVAYATSKAALSGMTRALAVDVGSRIRVNAIEPAAIDTQMLQDGFEGNEIGYRELQAFHPMGRIGSSEEIGKLAVFIAKKSSAFIHGATLSVDGGIGSRLFDPC